mmetsp:Transcript_18330/g.41006  ORF Transcript_18330/g.41006 Transcript_18330/m.41006 type:complete len:230 (-) Transcript_18330:309-998(-)
MCLRAPPVEGPRLSVCTSLVCGRRRLKPDYRTWVHLRTVTSGRFQVPLALQSRPMSHAVSSSSSSSSPSSSRWSSPWPKSSPAPTPEDASPVTMPASAAPLFLPDSVVVPAMLRSSVTRVWRWRATSTASRNLLSSSSSSSSTSASAAATRSSLTSLLNSSISCRSVSSLRVCATDFPAFAGSCWGLSKKSVGSASPAVALVAASGVPTVSKPGCSTGSVLVNGALPSR